MILYKITFGIQPREGVINIWIKKRIKNSFFIENHFHRKNEFYIIENLLVVKITIGVGFS